MSLASMAIHSNKHAGGHVSASYPVKASVEGRDRRLAISFLIILMLSICFQRVSFFKVRGTSTKPYHLIAIALLRVSAAKRHGACSLPSIRLTLFLILMTILSFAGLLVYCLSTPFFSYAVFCIVVVMVFNLGQGPTAEDLRRIGQDVGFAFLIILLLQIAYYRQGILRFFADSWGCHLSIPSISGGGVTLDTSRSALFGVFFNSDLKGNLFLVGSLGGSALYASVAGMVLAVLALFAVYVLKPRDRGFLKKALIVLLPAAAALIAVSASGDIILDRFLSIGDEAGSEGRSNTWQHPLTTFLDAPILGAGAGNFFLQVLLAFGIVGLVVYILILGRRMPEFVRGGSEQLLSLSPLLGCWTFPAGQGPGRGGGLRSWLLASSPFDGRGSQSRRLGRAACFGCAAW